MKKTILISFMFCVFGVFSLNAQDQKVTKDSKDSEVTLGVAMDCGNCAEKVKKQLAYTKGVKDVKPDLEKQEVVVKYRNDKTDTNKLIASLAEIGYTAKVVDKNCKKDCANKKDSCCSGHDKKENSEHKQHSH